MSDEAEPVGVRHHGRARELSVGRSCASWYEPGKVVTGSLWDALAVPVLLLPPARRQKLLILGLGGGSGARVLRALAPDAEIVGVERSEAVLEAARRDLDLDEIGVKVVVDDARRFLERDDGRYDAIVEDVFSSMDGDLRKPDWLPEPGLALAHDRLAPEGILICDAIDEAPHVAFTMLGLFTDLLRIDLDDCDNRIYVGSDAPLSAHELTLELNDHPLIGPVASNMSVSNAEYSAAGT